MHPILDEPLVAQVTGTLHFTIPLFFMCLEFAGSYLRGSQHILHLYTLPPAYLHTQGTSSETL